jgi:Tol biopolymer transport system component
MNDVFRVSASGGTPMEVAADRYTNEYFAAAAPDGRGIALTARANAFGQWWRNGRSHLDEAEVWLARERQTPAYEPVTGGGAKEMWPMWAADGRALYFVSDRSGAQNIWRRDLGPGSAAARPVTTFKSGRVLWPSISLNGRLIAFEHDYEIWTVDTTTERAARLPVTRRGVPATAGVEHMALTEGFTELDLSPDGKKVAFVARGEVFAASAKDGGDATRISRTPEAESHVMWSPDSRTLVYTSRREGAGHLYLYLYDFAAGAEARLTNAGETDHSPRFSPDGKVLAFIRGDSELRALDLATRQECGVARGVFDRPPFAAEPPFAWSPDNRWLAYLSAGAKMFTNVNVVSADGAASRPVSFLANSFANTVSWSTDGNAVYFDTGQRTELRQIGRIDLTPRTPQFREDQFRDLFREEPVRPPRPVDPPRDAPEPAAAPAAAPEATAVRIEFEDIRAAPDAAADRARCRVAAPLPGRQDLADHRTGRRPTEPVHVLDRRAGTRACRGTAVDLDAGREERRRVHTRRQGSVPAGAGPHHHRHRGEPQLAAAVGHRGDGRGLRNGKDGSVPAGLVLPARQLL